MASGLDLYVLDKWVLGSDSKFGIEVVFLLEIDVSVSGSSRSQGCSYELLLN